MLGSVTRQASRPFTQRRAAATACAPRRVAVVARSRRNAVTVQAIFGNLFSPAAPSASKAAQLVDELITLTSSRPAAAEVEELVKALQPLGTKAPVRSKQLFGEYKLIYSSKTGAAPRQILEEPDVIREVSEGKALGLLSTTNTLYGFLNGVDNTTYEEAFERLEVKGPLSTETREVEVARQVTLLYLDPTLRVVKVATESDPQGSLAIYQRVVADAGDEDDDEAAPPKKSGTGIFAFGAGPKEGTATIAEREVRQKLAAEKARQPGTQGTQKASTTRGASPPARRSPTPAPRAGTTSVNRAQEAAAAKEKAAAIKSLIDQLTGDLKEAQANAREAAKEAKDVERANASVLKQVAGARSQLKGAADAVEAVEADIRKAGEARAAAEAALKEALGELNAAQSALKAAARK